MGHAPGRRRADRVRLAGDRARDRTAARPGRRARRGPAEGARLVPPDEARGGALGPRVGRRGDRAGDRPPGDGLGAGRPGVAAAVAGAGADGAVPMGGLRPTSGVDDARRERRPRACPRGRPGDAGFGVPPERRGTGRAPGVRDGVPGHGGGEGAETERHPARWPDAGPIGANGSGVAGAKKAPPLTWATFAFIGPECTVDDAKARSELGYTPVVDHDQAMEDLAAAAATKRRGKTTRAR